MSEMNLVWKYSEDYKTICKVLEEKELWGQQFCQVWLPEKYTVVQIPSNRLKEIRYENDSVESERIGYLASATNIYNLLKNHSADDLLLSATDANIIPLPHQLKALKRAVLSQRVRFLLADEVGLGKTIEAGLIMRELKIRGLVNRILIVSPKSLAIQWVAEMKNHFNEVFSIIEPSDLDVFLKLKTSTFLEQNKANTYNPWLDFQQVIVTLDSVKPLRNRKGWSEKRIYQYNKNRFANLIAANWDLIIIDEAHKLGGSNDKVARFQLGQALAESTPYLLLLSATPHQGKSDAFQRLMSLLDPMSFPDEASITKETVQKFVIRTEKRKAVDDKGNPLFQPRTTNTIKVNLLSHPLEFELYEEVSEYARKGYNIALKDKKPHIGFLMVLLQRIATSSTFAIKSSLEKRLFVLDNLHDQVNAFNDDLIELFPEMTGQEMVDELLEINEKGRIEELERVRHLLAIADRVEKKGPDKKALELFEQIYTIQSKEKKLVKILIFTEFIATQEMLKRFLEERGLTCAILNGSMDMQERLAAQNEFKDNARVLISTDAGGEGLNLQFCHIIINYDLPWNPMRVEQRIGRVDRIGQKNIVKALNFVYAGSVEERVREVLEKKLEIVLHDIGIDKKGDILESSVNGEFLEKIMTKAIMEEANIEYTTEKALSQLKDNQLKLEEEQNIYTISEEFDLMDTEKVQKHPLPFWIEKMTLNYLKLKNIKTNKTEDGLNWQWPDGESVTNANFHDHSKKMSTDSIYFSDKHIKGLLFNIPKFSKGQLIPICSIKDVPSEIKGIWSVFEISLESLLALEPSFFFPDFQRKKYFSLFVSDNDEMFLPTASYIWDLLQSQIPLVTSRMNERQSLTFYNKLFESAQIIGEQHYNSLLKDHEKQVSEEVRRGQIYFDAKLSSINQLGLDEVREYRIKKFKEEKKEWEESIDNLKNVVPDINPIILLKVNGLI